MLIKSIFFISLILNTICFGAKEKLPLPRFASIKSNEVNARVGPSIKSDIKLVYLKKGEPIQIISEYDQWREIKDVDSYTSWVHSSLLSGIRYVILKSDKIANMYSKASKASGVVAKLSPKLRCLFIKTENEFCKVKCQGYTGFIEIEYLWGV